MHEVKSMNTFLGFLDICLNEDTAVPQKARELMMDEDIADTDQLLVCLEEFLEANQVINEDVRDDFNQAVFEAMLAGCFSRSVTYDYRYADGGCDLSDEEWEQERAKRGYIPPPIVTAVFVYNPVAKSLSFTCTQNVEWKQLDEAYDAIKAEIDRQKADQDKCPFKPEGDNHGQE